MSWRHKVLVLNKYILFTNINSKDALGARTEIQKNISYRKLKHWMNRKIHFKEQSFQVQNIQLNGLSIGLQCSERACSSQGNNCLIKGDDSCLEAHG